MTNKEAFMVYYPDSARAELVLANKSITSAATTDNPVSSAWGMIEKTKDSDYSQGRTSETMSKGARQRLLADAKAILKDNGIYYNDGLTPSVGAVRW